MLSNSQYLSSFICLHREQLQEDVDVYFWILLFPK